MNRYHGRTAVIVIVLIALAALAVWWFWPESESAPTDNGGTADTDAARAGTNGLEGERTESENGDTASQDSGDDSEQPQPFHSRLDHMSETEARRAYRRGLELLAEDDPIAARRELSRAILSGELPQNEEADAVEKAAELAERTILSREVFPDDPYAEVYTVQSGERLAVIANNLDLRVPWEAILRVNNMSDARSLRAGQDIKVVKGPFHAIVTQRTFTCDVYLQRGDHEPVFVKRMPVGLGEGGATPNGLWKVSSKLPFATWYPPPNAPQSGPIRPGEPEYPLGEKGLWIGIEGIEGDAVGRYGYGIHGTDEPESIGQAESLGCIRLGDDDIELLFELLREDVSTVEIRP